MEQSYPKPNQAYTVFILCLTYNHEKYIEDTLKGFIMQKTTFPYVALIIDDASTDNTVNIIKDYENKYPDIIKGVYLKENHYSKGKSKETYIRPWRDKSKYEALCEGDDYWIDPLKLQKQIDFLETNTDFTLCGTNGIVLWENASNSLEYFNNIFSSQELFPNHIIGKWAFPTASLVFRNTIIENYPKWTSEIYSGDLTLILIAMNKGRIYAFSDITCIYRRSLINKSSLSNIASLQRNYVNKQHLLLYQKYSSYVNGKFDYEINSIIKKLTRNIQFEEMKQKSLFHSLINDPILFYLKCKNHLLTKVKNKLFPINIQETIID